MASFRCVLLNTIRPEDRYWSFQVKDLPRSNVTNASKLVKLISVTSNAKQQQIALSFIKSPTNRAISEEPLNKFALISFTDFRLRYRSPTNPELTEPAPARETTDYILRLLTAGVTINGVQYNFYGHSNSQLKSRSCFLYAAPRQEIATKIEELGDFSKIKSVAKKAKRIGLLFSSTQMGVTLNPDRYEDIPDIQTKDYNFTDGCGLISPILVQQLTKAARISFRNQKYTPSVIQIRYRGYKGVLTLEPALKGKLLVQFRESMRKFKEAKDLTLSVVDYSKPYSFGYLNDEVILLLHALGIDEKVLVAKQNEHLGFLARVEQLDARTSFQFLSYCNEVELAERLLVEGTEAVRSNVRKLVKAEYDKLLNKKEEQRCRILIVRSRLLFGICDPRNVLKEGECAVRITGDGDGRSVALTGAQVIVTRNPCLHPGDIRKFKVVERPELAHLVDCIIFPTKGGRASADLMSGGDLDGDKFFVSWDPDIIPTSISEPAEYPGAKEPLSFAAITDDDRIKYFSGYTSVSLGRVKNLFLDWARLKGPMSPECQQLNRLFSQCVDGNRIKVPDSLTDPPKPSTDGPSFILDLLHESAREVIEMRSGRMKNLDGYSFDAMEVLLCRDRFAISEFEMIKSTTAWCEKHEEYFVDYLPLFDLHALNDEEKAWTLAQLPVTKELPSLLMNGLLQSNLVTGRELSRFKLDYPGLRWKQIFNGEVDRMGTFLDKMARTLELFHKKLIILRIDERLTLAIYVPKKLQQNKECTVDGAVRVFAFPHSQGDESSNYKVVPTKVNYRLYFDGNSFQLYNGARRDTWIFLNHGPTNDSSFRNISDVGNRRRQKQVTLDERTNFDCRASVALNKISQNIQKHVGRVRSTGVLSAEIYVISNRDLKALQTLDLWVEFVDTNKTLPLFEAEAREFSILKLRHLQWNDLPIAYARIVRDGELTQLRLLDSLEELRSMLDWLITMGERMKVYDIYNYLLEETPAIGGQHSEADLLSFMVGFLVQAPFACVRFLHSAQWKKHRKALDEQLCSIAPSLLRVLVLSGPALGDLVVTALQVVLAEVRQLGLQSFAELVELVALTARTPDFALRLLLECMDPEVSRLLVGRPRAIDKYVKALFGLALDHVEEATDSASPANMLLQLADGGESQGCSVVEIQLRLDAPKRFALRIGDHVRLRTASRPQNSPLEPIVEIDGIAERVNQGSTNIRCLQQLPSYYQECSWEMQNCGSFVTCKSMIDALLTLFTERERCCRPYEAIIGLQGQVIPNATALAAPNPNHQLNESQNRAVAAAMKSSVSLLWGPPGTGKTRTVVEILEKLLASSNKRVLVAAPTHNAVDNVLRKFIEVGSPSKLGVTPVRVSTDVRKVADDLKRFTCDAMLGKDLNINFEARRKAQKRVKECRLVFTTCIGANLGLLRDERFQYVVIDEASQQTEPMTLVPLVKGCEKFVLVGDHVQLRATTQQYSKVVNFDVSLFERLYNADPRLDVSKVMLDTQYRMHRDICAFSSKEFYDNALQTAVPDDARPLIPSKFPWPSSTSAESTNTKRMVFLKCSEPEDLGSKSKSNRGQASLCQTVCKLLCTAPDTAQSPPKQSLVVLTPYTRQITLLEKLLSGIEVSSIDGFQGREADIIVFVTVRSNQRKEMGFLKDMRRLNVAVTRARAALIVIGDVATLAEGNDEESAAVWRRLVASCAIVEQDLFSNSEPEVSSGALKKP